MVMNLCKTRKIVGKSDKISAQRVIAQLDWYLTTSKLILFEIEVLGPELYSRPDLSRSRGDKEIVK